MDESFFLCANTRIFLHANLVFEPCQGQLLKL